MCIVSAVHFLSSLCNFGVLKLNSGRAAVHIVWFRRSLVLIVPLCSPATPETSTEQHIPDLYNLYAVKPIWETSCWVWGRNMKKEKKNRERGCSSEKGLLVALLFHARCRFSLTCACNCACLFIYLFINKDKKNQWMNEFQFVWNFFKI